MEKKIVVMGLGYIGLPTATLLAGKKNRVLGVDINPHVVETINKGHIHIVEPDLEGLVTHVVNNGFLRATVRPETADVFIIAVPTPFKENNLPDISFVESSVRAILPSIQENNLVIIESTCPVGTTSEMYKLIISERPELENNFYMCYCPERVLPGKIIYELEHNDRVIGGINAESTSKAIEFYSGFVIGNLHPTNSKTAEMCKLVENSSRDVQIAFANELSIICDKIGIDVWELIQLANKHPRVNILQPGPGVGGHCIAVDPWFLATAFENEARIIRTAREINDYKSLWSIEKIKNEAFQFKEKYHKKPVIACFGLAFKPNIDDLRESPSFFITKQLIKEGFQVLPVEPNVRTLDGLTLFSIEEAIQSADIIAMLVNHQAFQNIKTDKTVLDFCGFNQNKV